MTIDIKKENVWIWGIGVAGKWASDNINSNVKGFIDSGAAKHNLKYNNLSVYSPEKVQKIIKDDDLILVTVLDIQDVIPVIESRFINPFLIYSLSSTIIAFIIQLCYKVFESLLWCLVH